MTRTQIIELIRQRLGFNLNLDQEHILLNMLYVQRLYELGHDRMPLPWFAFQAEAEVWTFPDTNYVELPEGFVQFDNDWPLSVVAEGITYALDREPMYELASVVNQEKGRPKYFEMDGGKIYLFPTPDKVYKINLPHFSTTTPLNTTTTSPWFVHFPLLLVEEVANSFMRSTRDIEGLKLSTVNQLRADYVSRVEARTHQLKSYRSA